MPITLPPSRNRITALAGQTQFNYTFADTGTTQSPIIVSTLKLGDTNFEERTLTLNYTLDRSTKTITFLIAPVTTFGAGVIVEIARATSRTRNITHDPASTVTSAILNRDEEQSFRYKQELEAALNRKLGLNPREDEFLAADRKIITLKDATDPQDAMNRRTTLDLISAAGNVNPPGAGKTGFVLTEESPTTFGFHDRGVPIPATGDLDKVLVSDGSGEGNYRWANRGVDIPTTADADKVLVADGSGEGNHRWADRGVPIPNTGDLDKLLQVTGSGEGAVAFGLQLPLPTAPQVGAVATATGAGTAAWSSTAVPAPNLVMNSDFSVAQRGITFTSATVPANDDDEWLLDRWLLLSELNNTVDVSQEKTIVPDGAYASIKLEVETANDKFGIAQIFEARDTKRMLRDGVNTIVSLSFEARTTTGNAIRNLRAIVLAFDGATEDVVISDLVGTWNAEGTNITPAADWTIENVAVDLPIVDNNTFQRFTINNIALDTAGTKNLALFVWIDDADAAVNDVVYISKIKLEHGSVARDYESPTFADELARARRYCHVFEPGVAGALFASGMARTTGIAKLILQLPIRMRRVPDTTIYSAAGDFHVMDRQVLITVTSFTNVLEGADAVEIRANASGFTAGDGVILQDKAGAAKIIVNAEL